PETPFLNSCIDFPSERAISGSRLAPKKKRTRASPTRRSWLPIIAILLRDPTQSCSASNPRLPLQPDDSPACDVRSHPCSHGSASVVKGAQYASGEDRRDENQGDGNDQVRRLAPHSENPLQTLTLQPSRERFTI